MPTRWARIALCTLAVSTALLVSAGVVGGLSGGLSGGVAGAAEVAAGSGSRADPPALTLESQTPVITTASPWFRLALGVGETAVASGDLYVTLTFYNRITDLSQLQQATGATPDKTTQSRVDLPVTLTPLGRVSTACVTVLPESSSTPPAPPVGTTPCPAGAPSDTLNCEPDIGRCIGVYPISVALFRHGNSSALSRFTTFLAYQETIGAGNGPLRVGLIMPVGPQSSDGAAPTGAQQSATESETTLLAEHDNVHVTLAVAPASAAGLAANRSGKARTARDELADLTDPTDPSGGDQLLSEPYSPINLAGLAAAKLSGEIGQQMARGTTLLRQAGLHPTPGAWVDTTSQFSTADDTNLASGLRTAGAHRLVVDDSVLASGSGASQSLTFSQTFALDLGHGARVSAAATNSVADSRFTADAGDPSLAANQLLATLEFIHFEDPYTGTRGVVVEPPAGWHPNSAFLSTLLSGMSQNPVVTPVTLDEFFAQVPAGGNSEPASMRLQSGPAAAAGAISKSSAERITVARAHLHSFTLAVSGRPTVLTTLSDQLLSTESQTINAARRSARLDAYNRSFGTVLSAISLGAEHTITFTSRTAQIPIAVDSTAPYRVTVVMSLSSDKFIFPSGDTRTLTLSHPTTAVRIPARARTSGDRLPVDVTLRTPDGDLLISHTVLTVHATAISLVGVGLTVAAGLVLLVWWGRTWRRGRRHRPRAHAAVAGD